MKAVVVLVLVIAAVLTVVAVVAVAAVVVLARGIQRTIGTIDETLGMNCRLGWG
jgi:hypothetical protein